MPTEVQDLSPFANALHLYPTKEAVVEHNVAKLHDSIINRSPRLKQSTRVLMYVEHQRMKPVE